MARPGPAQPKLVKNEAQFLNPISFSVSSPTPNVLNYTKIHVPIG